MDYDNLTLADDLILYPPPPEHPRRAFFILGCLMVSLVMSIAGNASQFSWQQYTQHIYTHNKHFIPNFQLFIARLICITQFGMALTLPAVIVDYLLEYWIFNSFFCSLHFVLLNFGRTATAWLVVILFLNQILQEKHFRVTEKRKKFLNKAMLYGILIFGAILLLPSLRHIQLAEHYDPNIKIKTQKCLMSFDNNSNTRLIVNVATFIVDFVTPLFLITATKIYHQYYKHKNQQLINSKDNKIQKKLIVIATIFFSCNAPHWFAVGLILFGDNFLFQIYGWEAGIIADVALLGTYIIPAVIWHPLSSVSNVIFKNMDDELNELEFALNSNSLMPISRSRIFSNCSNSECQSLPGKFNPERDLLKPSYSLNPIISEQPAKKPLTKNLSVPKKATFKEIKNLYRSRRSDLETLN